MSRRLLFCTQTAHAFGGLETWLDEIVPFLEGRGWEVIVALARGRRFHDPERYRAAHPRFRTVEIDGRAGTRESRVASLGRVLREVSPDVVVPVGIVDTLEAVARAKLAGRSPRLVVMLRAQVPHGELEDLRRFREFVDIAVGGNRLLRALIVEWSGIPEGRVRYIPPGSRRKTTNARVPGSARIRIGYVGRLSQRDKRVLELVDLAGRLDEAGVGYELLVAGDGPDRESLASGLGGRGRLLGNLPVDELYASVFPQLDVLVHFSEAEAGPQVVWQAMHYGVVPVVSEYQGARAEGVLRHGETAMVFAVGDVAAAAEHVRTLAADRAMLERLGAAAERAVEPDYLLDSSFERWLEVFEEAGAMAPVAGKTVPALTPSGRLARLHVPSRLAHVLRRLVGREAESSEEGDEWPHTHGNEGDSARRIAALAREIERGRGSAGAVLP